MDVSVYGVVGGLHHVQLEGTLSNVFAVQSNMQFQWPGDHGRILHKVLPRRRLKPNERELHRSAPQRQLMTAIQSGRTCW